MSAKIAGRKLVEQCRAGSPLKVDRERGVIENVKVLGFHSRNSHGLREAVNGTEYTRKCMEGALPLYEGADVLVDHEVSKRARGTGDVFGQLRGARLAEDGIRADLHYLKSHPLAERICEDVERSLGVYGLSHDARAGRERFDPASKRLVIESLNAVMSVDLVRKPASNANLWEGQQPMSTTLRQLLEDRRPKLSKPRRKWADRLLEDDMMAPAMDAPAEVADGGDEEDALWSGFQAAIQKVMDSYKAGECDAKEAGKKIADWIKAHDKLTGNEEPEEPVKEEADDAGKKSDEDKTESVKELAAAKHKLAVRELADDLGIRGDKTLLETAEKLPDLAAARKLFEREKARGGSPRSSGFTSGGNGAGNGKAPADAKEFASSIKD